MGVYGRLKISIRLEELIVEKRFLLESTGKNWEQQKCHSHVGKYKTVYVYEYVYIPNTYSLYI